jgi:hypothetical protein
MDLAVPDCLVCDYDDIAVGLKLPDEGDNHVLAAAIAAECDSIITFNLKDFPKEYLARFNVEPQHPDEFIHHQFGLNNAAVIIAAQRCRARLRNPPKSAEEYLAILESQALPQTVAELIQYSSVL